MFSRQIVATGTRLNSSINLLADSQNIFALPRSYRNESNLPGFVFVGERREQVSIRLIMFASGDDPVGSFALLKFLVDLNLAPLLGHDYALFCYLNAPGLALFSRLKDYRLHREKGSLPRDFRALDPDGLISVQTNDSVGGLQVEASDRTIANEVVWPALAPASKVYQLDAEPVRYRRDYAWFNGDEVPSNTFKLALHTPYLADPENQIAAVSFTLKEILLQYRSLRNFAKKL
jgi:hypothetical protein